MGRDAGREDCTSDNYRISSFQNYSIVSYLQAAWGLVATTFAQDFGTPPAEDPTDPADPTDSSGL